ncbi:hypothetical protein [Rugosimonospora africana]|uniref:hypothetical protein n=1 Tax=Rugosimonospora africana TaxID=556532 RepID=UPI001944AB28|nr:hypothetical protein [Rugosimonospora africana]
MDVIDPSWNLLQQPGGNRGAVGAFSRSLIVGDLASLIGEGSPARWPVNDPPSASTGTASEHLIAIDAHSAHERDTLIAAVIRRLDQMVGRLTDLSWAGFDVLRVTCAHGHIGVRELTRRAGMPGQPFGPAVDLLVARQLAAVVGEPHHPTPALHATAAGCGVVRRVGPAVAVEERRVLHQVTAVRAVTGGFAP